MTNNYLNNDLNKSRYQYMAIHGSYTGYYSDICVSILAKVKGPPNWRLHINSGRYVSWSFECMALSSLSILLQQLHIDSTPWVWAIASGSLSGGCILQVGCKQPTCHYIPHFLVWHAAWSEAIVLPHLSSQPRQGSTLLLSSPFRWTPSDHLFFSHDCTFFFRICFHLSPHLLQGLQ